MDQELRAGGIGMRLGRLLSTNVLVEDFESMNWVVQHIEAAAQREALEADIDPTCPVEQVGGSLHVGRKADSEGDNTAQSHTIEAEEGDIVVVEEHLPRYTAVGHIQGRGAEEVGSRRRPWERRRPIHILMRLVRRHIRARNPGSLMGRRRRYVGILVVLHFWDGDELWRQQPELRTLQGLPFRD